MQGPTIPGALPAILVVVVVGLHRLGVPLDRAERVERMVAVTPLPGAPPPVIGVVDCAGDLLPVFDARRCLGMDSRPPSPDDLLLVVRTPRRRVLLCADGVGDPAVAAAERLATPADGLPELPGVRGVARLADGLVLVVDVEAFLAPAADAALDRALLAASPPA